MRDSVGPKRIRSQAACRRSTIQPAPSAASVNFKDYWQVFDRQKVLIGAITLACLLGATAYALLKPAQYTATSTVLVKSILATQGVPSSTGAVNMATEAALVTTEAVAGPAATTIGWKDTLPNLLKNVGVTNPPVSALLVVSYKAGSPEAAKTGADAFANAYLLARTTEAQQAVRLVTDSLMGRIGPLQRRIIAINAHLTRTQVGSAHFQVLTASRQALANQLQAYQNQLFAMSSPVDPGYVVTPAEVPTSQSGVTKKIILPLGLLVGLFLGALAAFIADRRDNRVRTRSDVEMALDAPVIAIIPPSKRRMLRRRSRAPAPWAVQGLAFAIERNLRGRRGTSILIAGPTRKVQAERLFSDTGRQLARDGKRVVMTSTIPTRRFEGQTSARSDTDRREQKGSVPTSETLQETELSNLSILPPASMSSNGGEGTARAEWMRKVVGLVADGAEVILGEGDPLLMVRGMAWANNFDKVIVLADPRVTTRTELAQVRFLLEQAGTRAWGAIVLNLRGSADDYALPMRAETAPLNPSALVSRYELHFTPAENAGELPGGSGPQTLAES